MRLVAGLAHRVQELVELGLDRQRVAVGDALDQERHEPDHQRRDGPCSE